MLAQTQQTHSCPKAEPGEQRGFTLYTLASRLQKQKARSNPYMVVFNFTGYFILVVRDFPLPGATWSSSCSDFSGFVSLVCHPYLPATFSGLRPRLFSSHHSPCYIRLRKRWLKQNHKLKANITTDNNRNTKYYKRISWAIISQQNV
jgi:hypothetical protein